MEISLIKNRDFIIFGLQPWDISIGSNCKNIATEISKHNRVLYVNRPLDRVTKIKLKNDIQTKNRIESIQQGTNTLLKENENLWVFNPRIILESINFLPAGLLYNYFNRSNNKKLANEINRVSNQLRFANAIMIIDNDFFNALYLKEFVKPSIFIYYIRDFLLSQQYFTKHGSRAEALIIQKADFVAANSKYLAGYASKFNKSVGDVGQGCDVEDFLQKPTQIPPDVADIPYPIIGYCGSLTSTRLDIDLINFIATQRPQWNIVLVGPEDENFKSSLLHQKSNIYFSGAKETASLPLYTHTFDVCINPQLLNQMTIGNYPRKVDEYLAAGKPVVATKTEAMEIFSAEVFLCENKEQYIENIEKILKEKKDENKIELRKKMAKSHTWNASVNKIYKLILSK
jgi:glycosyltransferase involved in cell wall biosynthesis